MIDDFLLPFSNGERKNLEIVKVKKIQAYQYSLNTIKALKTNGNLILKTKETSNLKTKKSRI